MPSAGRAWGVLGGAGECARGVGVRPVSPFVASRAVGAVPLRTDVSRETNVLRAGNLNALPDARALARLGGRGSGERWLSLVAPREVEDQQQQGDGGGECQEIAVCKCG